MRVPGSAPQTSAWACGGNSASCQGCTPTTEDTQPVDPHALAISRTAVKNVTGSASRPPALFGWSSRKKPVSASALTDSAGSIRLSSASDRKSTRLNSSHVEISYAVFCLKKKKKKQKKHRHVSDN